MLDSFATLWTVAHQAPLSIGFPRQGYWTGLSFPSTGDLADPGTKPASPALAGRFFTTEPPGKPKCRVHHTKCWAKSITSWNQDCQEKYQLQICIWYHSNGRKWRGTKEPLNEGERGKWKSSLIFLFLLIFYHLNSTSLNKCLGFAHKSSTLSNLFSLQRCHADISHIRTTPPTLDVHGEVRCLVSHHGNMPSPKMPVYMNKNSKSMVDMALF